MKEARLQIRVSKEMEEKLEAYAEYFGLDKSSYVRQLLTFGLRQADEEVTKQLQV